MINKSAKNKTITRLAATQAIYLYDLSNYQSDIALENIINYYNTQNPLEEYDILSTEQLKLIDKNFLNKIFQETTQNLEKIDTKITSLLTKQQNISQLSSMLRAILRVGVCELLFFPTPYKVVIDEYVTLAKDFYSLTEVNFINSILDKVANQELKHE
jgi:N utilization substance protein B